MPYFGVQFGGFCFGGSNLTAALDMYGPMTDCTMQCSGDDTQYCGGSWEQNLYFTYPEDVCQSNPCAEAGVTDATCTAVSGGVGLSAYDCNCPANSVRLDAAAACTCEEGYYLYFGSCY